MSATRGGSGFIDISTGDAEIGPSHNDNKGHGKGGDITLSVGTGNHGDGGSIKMRAGSTTDSSGGSSIWSPLLATGGSVEIVSGSSMKTSSGAISIATQDAGSQGVSGTLILKTGEATSGDAGEIGML